MTAMPGFSCCPGMEKPIEMTESGRNFLAEDGVVSVEYSFIALLVALAILLAATGVGASVRALYDSVVSAFP